jgi:hypothetical protein
MNEGNMSIVERLREQISKPGVAAPEVTNKLHAEAADEIERLTAGGMNAMKTVFTARQQRNVAMDDSQRPPATSNTSDKPDLGHAQTRIELLEKALRETCEAQFELVTCIAANVGSATPALIGAAEREWKLGEKKTAQN